MAVDPRNFLLNTDYEMDKIIYFSEGSVDTGQTVTLSHGLSFIPLVFGVCAFNSDFSDSRTIPYNYTTASNSITFDIQSTATNVSLTFSDQSGSQSKMYYRIYGFEPTNSSAAVAPTNEHAKKFVLNTDYNYCKLYKKGIQNGDGSVAHNLGYIPQVLVWREASNAIYPVEQSTPSDPISNYPEQVQVTTQNISFQNIGKAHYRIYYDEA